MHTDLVRHLAAARYDDAERRARRRRDYRLTRPLSKRMAEEVRHLLGGATPRRGRRAATAESGGSTR